DAQNLRNLLAGVIDGFLAPRSTATTTAWRWHEGARIEEHRLRFSPDIHFMLSRATQTPQMLARLNDAIDELRRSGELRRIADAYALPVLINQTLDTQWFRILAFIGIVAFAVSGVVLAYEGQYTMFGALVLAALPAVGGGIVRDLLLQRDPLGIVQDPEALLDRVRHRAGGHGGHQNNTAASSWSLDQIPAIARASRHAVDRGVRRHRAGRFYRRRGCGRVGHIHPAAL